MALKYLSISSLKTENCSGNGLSPYEEMLAKSLEWPIIRGFKSRDYLTSLTGRKKSLKPTAVPSLFFWKQGSPVKRKSPKKRSRVERKIVAKGSETSNANAANANTNSMWGLVTAGAINEEIDKDPMCWKSTIEARKMKVCLNWNKKQRSWKTSFQKKKRKQMLW